MTKPKSFFVVVALSGVLLAICAGCSHGPDRTSKEWTQAPPPSSPTAHRESKPANVRIPTPPQLGAPGVEPPREITNLPKKPSR
jgi:hypothetical protein